MKRFSNLFLVSLLSGATTLGDTNYYLTPMVIFRITKTP
jgi:hypothetical protein